MPVANIGSISKEKCVYTVYPIHVHLFFMALSLARSLALSNSIWLSNALHKPLQVSQVRYNIFSSSTGFIRLAATLPGVAAKSLDFIDGSRINEFHINFLRKYRAHQIMSCLVNKLLASPYSGGRISGGFLLLNVIIPVH